MCMCWLCDAFLGVFSLGPALVYLLFWNRGLVSCVMLEDGPKGVFADWSRLCMILFWCLFLWYIYCSRDSSWWKFPSTTLWWSGVTTMLCSWGFRGFGWRNLVVPLACDWNHVLHWVTHMLILLVFHLPEIVGSYAFLFVVLSCTTCLLVTSGILHIVLTWSFLWRFVYLSLVNFCGSFLMAIIHIVLYPLLFFSVGTRYIIIEGIYLCLDTEFPQYIE